MHFEGIGVLLRPSEGSHMHAIFLKKACCSPYFWIHANCPCTSSETLSYSRLTNICLCLEYSAGLASISRGPFCQWKLWWQHHPLACRGWRTTSRSSKCTREQRLGPGLASNGAYFMQWKQRLCVAMISTLESVWYFILFQKGDTLIFLLKEDSRSEFEVHMFRGPQGSPHFADEGENSPPMDDEEEYFSASEGEDKPSHSLSPGQDDVELNVVGCNCS